MTSRMSFLLLEPVLHILAVGQGKLPFPDRHLAFMAVQEAALPLRVLRTPSSFDSAPPPRYPVIPFGVKRR
jgi:hypothetical protein